MHTLIKNYKTKQKDTSNSNIKVHSSQITKTNIIIVENSEIFWQLTKCDRDHKVSKCRWKSGTNRLARYKLPQTFNLFKKKRKKMWHLWRAIKGSVGEESTCNAGDPGSTPGLERYAREGIGYPLEYSWASLVAQMVKNLPATQETWVWSLGWEDPLEKGKATHSSILA